MQSLFIIVLRKIKADGRKMHSIFLSYFTKKQRLFFYCECTQIKEDLLQFRLSSWLRGVFASTARREKYKVLAPAPHALTFKHSTKCSLFIIIIKTTSQTYGKKHTAPFKYVVKSVLFSVITVQPWSYAKHLVLCGYCKGGRKWKVNNILSFKYREYGNIWFCVEGETQHWFQFCFSLN